MPFERLRLIDGRYWGQAQRLRFIQTGRDLLPAAVESTPGKGLLALGGIDFGDKAITYDKLDLAALEPAAGLAEEEEEVKQDLRDALDATRSQFSGFAPLDAAN